MMSSIIADIVKDYVKKVETKEESLVNLNKTLLSKVSLALKEAKENPIDVARRIVKNSQAEKVSGVLVDMQTANLIVQIYKAVKPVNKKRMEKMPMVKLANSAWKLVGRK